MIGCVGNYGIGWSRKLAGSNNETKTRVVGHLRRSRFLSQVREDAVPAGFRPDIISTPTMSAGCNRWESMACSMQLCE